MEYINQLINELMTWIHTISNDQVATFWLLLTAFGCGLLGKFLEQIGKKKKFEQMEARFRTIFDAMAELKRILEDRKPSKPEKPKEDENDDDDYDDDDDSYEEDDYEKDIRYDIRKIDWNPREKTLKFEMLNTDNCWYEAEAKYDNRNRLVWMRMEGDDDIRQRMLEYSKNWKKLQEYFHIN